ncbi:MAG: hypothetical protein SGJ04_02835 [Bacteroidota bacterium]|nr:hypothetical protein [Bacteroidota bacterium]
MSDTATTGRSSGLNGDSLLVQDGNGLAPSDDPGKTLQEAVVNNSTVDDMLITWRTIHSNLKYQQLGEVYTDPITVDGNKFTLDQLKEARKKTFMQYNDFTLGYDDRYKVQDIGGGKKRVTIRLSEIKNGIPINTDAYLILVKTETGYKITEQGARDTKNNDRENKTRMITIDEIKNCDLAVEACLRNNPALTPKITDINIKHRTEFKPNSAGNAKPEYVILFYKSEKSKIETVTRVYLNVENGNMYEQLPMDDKRREMPHDPLLAAKLMQLCGGK